MAITFYIEQFGCRATQADASAIERQLRDRGYASAANANAAAVVVVNTCTVTAAADLQARQAIDAIHRENPEARIVVTGCYAQRAPEELAELQGVAWVVGNSHKPEIAHVIDEMAAGSPVQAAAQPSNGSAFVPLGALAGDNVQHERQRGQVLVGNILERREFVFTPGAEPLLDSSTDSAAGHTRPVLKIQDGCDSRCSYCIIPQVRGRSRSLPPDRTIREIRRLADAGAREVVLSGIDLGSYGRDVAPRASLLSLLERVLRETLLEQLRISSIEPIDVTEDMVRLFAANVRLAPHFHLPLQSGADPVLAAMRRAYRAEHFAQRVARIHDILPDAAIGADVIAGFPGETAEDHTRTLALVEALPLTYLHVFSYSARPGTSAAEMAGQIGAKEIDRRARELRASGEKKKAQFRASQAGRVLRVLTLNGAGEDANGSWTRAISGNYLDLRIAGHWPANRFFEVRVPSAKRACEVIVTEARCA